jgi:hypothetical protein
VASMSGFHSRKKHQISCSMRTRHASNDVTLSSGRNVEFLSGVEIGQTRVTWRKSSRAIWCVTWKSYRDQREGKSPWKSPRSKYLLEEYLPGHGMDLDSGNEENFFCYIVKV